VARSDTTDFLVEVIEGPRAGEVIALAGRSLPYRAGQGGSISFGGTQRTKLVWYPGNPVATQLVFGQTLEPTTINGVWRERYLGEDEPIRLVELFEELRMAGVQLLVSWETIVRTGLIKSFKWVPGEPTGGLTDIGWECVFEWNGDGRPAPRKVGGAAAGSLRDLVTALASTLNDLRLGVGAISLNFGTLFSALSLIFAPTARDSDDINDALFGAFDSLVNSASRMATEERLPLRYAQDASSAAGRAAEGAADFGDLFGNLASGVAVATDDPVEHVLFELDRRLLVERTFDVIEQSYAARLRLDEMIQPSPYRRVRPAHGTDLRALALTYYGDADQWARIARANGLTTSRIPDDVNEIVIPTNTPDALDLAAVSETY
jgi:hypothetical protein